MQADEEGEGANREGLESMSMQADEEGEGANREGLPDGLMDREPHDEGTRIATESAEQSSAESVESDQSSDEAETKGSTGQDGHGQSLSEDDAMGDKGECQYDPAVLKLPGSV